MPIVIRNKDRLAHQCSQTILLKRSLRKKTEMLGVNLLTFRSLITQYRVLRRKIIKAHIKKFTYKTP